MQATIMLYQYLFIAALVAPLHAGLFKQCPKVAAVHDFDLQQFAGLWYDYAKNAPPFENTFVKCITYNFIKSGNNYSLNGLHDFYLNGVKIQEPVRLEEDVPNAGNGILKQKFGSIFGNTEPFTVVAVQYQKFAIIYDCLNTIFSIREKLQILTRDKNPSKEDAQTIKNELAKLKVDAANHLTFSDQVNCPTDSSEKTILGSPATKDTPPTTSQPLQGSTS